MMGGMQGATCVPSRAMLLSGRSLFRIDEKLQRDETWPAAFGRAGYTTFISGKWHNGIPSIPLSFQRAQSLFTGGMTDPLKAPLANLVNGKMTPPKVDPRHACAAFADEAIAFLGERHERPFLCYLPFDAPHDPHIVPADFPVRYAPEDIPLPANFLPQHPWNNGEMTVRDEALLPWPRSEAAIRAMLAEYYRYISYLDAQIGRVLDALERSPHAANTYVVFAADLRRGARQPWADWQTEPLRALGACAADRGWARRAGREIHGRHVLSLRCISHSRREVWRVGSDDE
jgi:arylsulfatase A-like enzyme